MNPKVHLAGVIGEVVKQVVDARLELWPCGSAECGGDGANSGEDGVVDGATVIQKITDNLLAISFLLLGEDWVNSKGFGILSCLTVGGWRPGVWRVLRTWWVGVVETLESFLDEAGHGAGDGTVDVVPIQMDSAKQFAIPVDGDVICFLQGGNEEIDIALAGVLHAEVVND